MHIPANAVGLAPHDQRKLRVRLQRRRTIRDMHAETLQAARPADVVRLVEARLELDEHRDLLTTLRRFDQCIDDRRVARRAVQRELDGEDVVVLCRGLEEPLDTRRERIEWVVNE